MINNPFDPYDLIVIDTSILLGLYEYPSHIVSDTLDILSENEYKIWLPNQVFKEFENNVYKNKFKEKAISNYKSMVERLSSVIESNQKEFSKNIFEYQQKRFHDIKNLSDNIEKKFFEIKDLIRDYNNTIKNENDRNKDFHKQELILKFINNLKNSNQIGPSYSPNDLLKIYSEGEQRYLYKIPPGYMDDLAHNKSGKNAPEKFGDLLVWKQFLNYVSNKELKILFITNDKKEDWIYQKEFREELLLEFFEHSPNSLLFKLNLDEFFEKITANLSLESKLEFHLNEEVKSILNNGDIFSSIESSIEDYIYAQISNPKILSEFISSTNLQVVSFKLESSASLELDDNCYIDEIETVSPISFNCNLTKKTITTSINFSGTTIGIINDFLETTFVFNAYLDLAFDIQIEDLSNITFSSFEILHKSFYLNSVDLEEKSVCSYCNTYEGLVEMDDGELICYSCSRKFPSCSSCGHVFHNYIDNVGVDLCHKCRKEKFNSFD